MKSPFLHSLRPGVFFLSLGVLLLLATCSVQLLGFTGPSEIGPGQVFQVQVRGSVGKGTGGTYMNRVGCVLQVPKGVGLVRWGLSDDGYILRKLNEPALLNLYKAELGYTLLGFSASGPAAGFSTKPVLTMTLRAPARLGTLTLKAAAAGEDGSPVTWRTQSPKGGGGLLQDHPGSLRADNSSER